MKTILNEINLGKIKLREINNNDYIDFYICGTDKLMCETLNWGPLKEKVEAMVLIKDVFNKRIEDGIPKGYAIVIDDHMVGMIDYHSYDILNNSIEIGYFLRSDYWGKGIMNKCLNKVIEQAFYFHDCDKVIIGSDIENKRSLSLILKNKLKYDHEEYVNYKNKMHLIKYYSIYKYEFGGLK